MASFFTLESRQGNARRGVLHTSRGDVPTPVFMPVGTCASVKTLDERDLQELGGGIILANTYHLYLRPGHRLIESLGGLHQFMGHTGPILTDSGGYQVFSLGKLNKITEEGVLFQSHLDGSRHLFTPELSMEVQKSLGSDIVMAFDECPPLPSEKETLSRSVQRTLRWAGRCRRYPLSPGQRLFGILQGGLHGDLRRECLESLRALDFDGLALGGLSVGEKNEEMIAFLESFVPEMPDELPRYLMGVGTPLDILQGVKAGIDMFDCVLPTRNARNGQLFTPTGPLNIKREEFKSDPRPPVPGCPCPLCSRHSRAWLRHLYVSGEPTAGRLATLHNLHFYLGMMGDIRRAIAEKTFDKYYQKFYDEYRSK